MEQNQITKTHRIGTMTCGILLVLFGILFLLNIFVPQLNYQLTFKLWPVIFIFLGLEVLAGNYKASRTEAANEGGIQFIYDKAAIFLMICLSFFAMLMASVDYFIQFSRVM